MRSGKQDINDFNARVKRIKNPRNTSYYDPDLGMHVPKRVARDKIKNAGKEDSFLAAFLVSMILGAVGLMCGEAILIRYFALTEPGKVALFLQLFVAFWAILFLSALLGRRRISARIAQIAGVIVMMMAEHNLIWRWPDQLAFIYTAEHVARVMETTTPYTIVLGGAVFGL